MQELAWQRLVDAPVRTRVELLLDASELRSALDRSVSVLRQVVSASQIEPTAVFDLQGAAHLLAIVLAPAHVWVREQSTGIYSERRTSPCTWKRACEKRRISLCEMWDLVSANQQESSHAGRLSWLDEFVLEGSCKGWELIESGPEDASVPEGSTLVRSRDSSIRKLRAWLIGTYGSFVLSILTKDYGDRRWSVQHSPPAEVSDDFWAFYVVSRWESIERAQYLGLASFRTHLYNQVRAFAKEKDRLRRPREQSNSADFLDARPDASSRSSHSRFLADARECIDRHKRGFGEEVEVWVNMILALCDPAHEEFSRARDRVPEDRRSPQSSVYLQRTRFFEAVRRCIAERSQL